MKPEILANLQKILSEFYPDRGSMLRLIADAGLDSSRIDLNSNPINNWAAILKEAKNLDRVFPLLEVINQEYGSNPQFKYIFQTYTQSLPTSQPIDSNSTVCGDETHGVSTKGDAPLPLPDNRFNLPKRSENIFHVKKTSKPTKYSFFEVLILALITITNNILVNVISNQIQVTLPISIVVIGGMIALGLAYAVIKLGNSSDWLQGHKVVGKGFIEIWPKHWKKILVSARAISLLSLVFMFIQLYQWWQASQCDTGQICIVIAQFASGQNTQTENFQNNIIREIKDALGSKNLKIISIGMLDSSNSPTEILQNYGAALLLWGAISNSENSEEILIQFEFSNEINGIKTVDFSHNYLKPLTYDRLNGRIVCTKCISLSTGYPQQQIHTIGHLVAGLTFYTQENFSDANLEFEEALRLNTDFSEKNVKLSALLYYYEGKALIQQGDYKKGIAQLQEATKYAPDDPIIWISIEDAYQNWIGPNSTEAQFAINQVQKLIETFPYNRGSAPDVLKDYYLGFVYELLGKFDDASENYANALKDFKYKSSIQKISRDSSETVNISLYQILVSYSRTQQRLHQAYNDATTMLEEAIKEEPNSPWAYLELANLYHNDKAKARQFLSQATIVAPREAHVDITRADLCIEWKIYNCAISAYALAKYKRPYYSWLLSRIGEFYSPSNSAANDLPVYQKWEIAAEYFRMAVNLRKKDPWANERYANALYHLKNYKISAKYYFNAIENAHPTHIPARLYCGRGWAEIGEGLVADAQKSQKSCSQLAKTSVDAQDAQKLLDTINASQQPK